MMDKKQTTEETIKEYGQTFGVKTEKEGWYGYDVQTKFNPMIDPGTGKPYILRCFEFARNLEWKGQITKQELFNMHWRQIQAMLWGDGLVSNEDVEPRIVFGKKKYRIFILCKPRINVVLTERPKDLQQLLTKKK